MSDPRKITLAEAQAALEAQGVEKRHRAMICPICATVQSRASLVRAGAKTEGVELYFGFSCEGRFSGAGPWPAKTSRSARAKARREVRGCDWTLGGLLQLHRLTILYPDGEASPSFEIATAAQARALRDAIETAEGPSHD